MEEKKTQLNDKDIKVLRTYTSDMAEAIRDNEMSVIKVALAEKEKREREEVYKEAEGTKTSKIFLTMGGILLIIMAIIGSMYLISKKKEVPIKTVAEVETFVAYDSYEYIDTTGMLNIDGLVTKIKSLTSQNTGLVKVLFPTETITDKSQLLTTQKFFSLFRINAPGALVRSLSDKYLVGQYFDKENLTNEKYKMFLIFQTDNYNQTYASMLDWEKTMSKDLSMMFNLNTEETTINNQSWKDLVLNNKDVRVLYGQGGEESLYYVFANKNKLIITNDINVLRAITAKLLAKNNQEL